MTSLIIRRFCSAAVVLLASIPVGAVEPDVAKAAVFDIDLELAGVTDYMDSGLTNSNHRPSASVTITPTYGIFYASLYIGTIDYGAPEPWLEGTYSVGATPTFGNFSLNLDVTRRLTFDEFSTGRWKPYATGTYTFNDMFSASLGVGYYNYDDEATVDFWEFYAAGTLTLPNEAYVTGELYFEPDQDAAQTDYYGLYARVGVPVMDKLNFTGKLGYEYYEDAVTTPPYLWSQLSVDYALTDHLTLTAGYETNTISETDCPILAYTDCTPAFFAKVGFTGKLSDLVAATDR